MSDSKHNDKLYLEDIRLSICSIEKYIKGMSFAEFSGDGRTIDAVVRNLEVLGEAANNVSKKNKEKYSQVPWKMMISMRNKVIHEYFGVDLEIVWKTIKTDLLELKKQLTELKR